ncbi:MAG: hypothetical protein EPN91_00030 [Salinibacterium sp.]|nr:MAG: hypothetical protein EPN91_00030 [Salinibacterium sp.]
MIEQRSISMEGLQEFYKRLAQLRGENLNKTTQKSAKAALKKTVVPPMKAATRFKGHGHGPNHGPPGRLLKAIDVRSARKRPGEMFALRVGPSGKTGASKPWYLHMVIGGTKAHMITPGGQAGGAFSSLIRRANRGQALALTIAGSLRSVVHHPGAKPNPFVLAGRGHEADLKAQLVRDLLAAAKSGATPT